MTVVFSKIKNVTGVECHTALPNIWSCSLLTKTHEFPLIVVARHVIVKDQKPDYESFRKLYYTFTTPVTCELHEPGHQKIGGRDVFRKMVCAVPVDIKTSVADAAQLPVAQ